LFSAQDLYLSLCDGSGAEVVGHYGQLSGAPNFEALQPDGILMPWEEPERDLSQFVSVDPWKLVVPNARGGVI
jgi:hypothetical protein